MARPPSSPRPGFIGHTPTTTVRAKCSLLYHSIIPLKEEAEKEEKKEEEEDLITT